ncbi:hypothetical protein CHS0354_023025 [Potamilus streckersoni]|uniref:Uncharacterized protein n=1 Tax=Potamilus streckersoni TaxID=2493646 RepID=A0AAE0RWD1_9BIVA|nr:hypothetical protein CHS0354_023025 [Potamilus streckersoni]
MRLDLLLQIVVLLEAYLCIVHSTGIQDKHKDNPTKHNGQKSVLDGKLTSHGDNRFRKIEKHDAFEQKRSHSDQDEESYQDESDKKGGSPFEFEKSDKSLIDQMKLLEQKLTSKPEWKEKNEMGTKSAALEGIDERVFEHSKNIPKADFSKSDSTVSPQEHSKREMENTGNNEQEVAGNVNSKSAIANDDINAKLFYYQIDGECDEQDEACSNKADKAFSDEPEMDTPVDRYKKENQDFNNLEKDRETQLEKLDEMYKLKKKRKVASTSTDQESFVDKTEGSLIDQLQILEQKIKQQDDWKIVYDKAENMNDYEIAKESHTPVKSIFIVAEGTQKSLLDQMKELETKVQQQENWKHSNAVSEHMLVNNELGMRVANRGESKESIDEKDLNPSPTAYFSKEGRDFMSEVSFVHKIGNEDEQEKLTHSVLLEDNSPGSLIDQMKILEQKIKSDDDWKREYGNDNNFEDALRERESEKLNAEMDDNLLVFKTSSHNGHINVETPADKYKREYQNAFYEKPHFMEETGGSLIDQMKKLEQKIKTKEDWSEVHDENSIHYEKKRDQSEIVNSIKSSADGTSAAGQNNVNLVVHERDGGRYFQKQKRQKCFQTKEYSIPQIDTVERVIDQVRAYEQQEMDRAKPDKEFSSVDFVEHMDDIGKSLPMHDQTVNSIPQTETPVSDVTPSKTVVINNTRQWISYLQMSCGTLAESTILKTGTKTAIERSTFMSKNIESSTTQIWFHSILVKNNRLESMANIGDNHQPTTKYQVKSKSLDVDIIYTEKDIDIVVKDMDNMGTSNSKTKTHGFPSNVLKEDNTKIRSTDNSKATQMKTFCHRPYGPSMTRTQLNTIPETDEDKDSMITSEGLNTKMPACASMQTIEPIADMHTSHTNAEVSTKQTIVNMNTMNAQTDMYTLQASVNVNTLQTSVDVNTRKTDKNYMQPTYSKDNSAGMNTVQMGSQVTTLPEIDTSLSLQIHMQLEPSISLWYVGTADFEKVSQHKEQIEQSNQDYVMNTPEIVLSSLVQGHKTSMSDHLSLTSIDSVSTLEISTSHELPWQPSQAESQSWGNKYSYFDNDALYQSTSESHQMIASISHTGYSDKNTRVR